MRQHHVVSTTHPFKKSLVGDQLLQLQQISSGVLT